MALYGVMPTQSAASALQAGRNYPPNYAELGSGFLTMPPGLTISNGCDGRTASSVLDAGRQAGGGSRRQREPFFTARVRPSRSGSRQPGMSPPRRTAFRRRPRSGCWASAPTRLLGRCFIASARLWFGLNGIGSPALSRSDETYVGGTEKGVRGRQTKTKSIVVIAVELSEPKGFGRVRLRKVPDVSGDSLVAFVRDVALPCATVGTDAWKGYDRQRINISATGDSAHVHLPAVHRVAAAKVASGNPSGGCRGGSPAKLSRRVCVPLQSTALGVSRPPVSKAARASRGGRPRHIQVAHRQCHRQNKT